MKLQTTIKPRRDGTVIATSPKGVRFVFQPNESRDLVCDVTDEAFVQYLLRNEDFLPYDAEDLAAAAALVGSPIGGGTDLDEIDHTEAGSPPGEGEAPDDDTGDENAAPVEGAPAAQPVEGASAEPARPSRRRS